MTNDTDGLSPEFRRLAQRGFDTPLTAEEFRKIESELTTSAEARRLYSRLAFLHADLLSEHTASETCERAFEENAQGTETASESREDRPIVAGALGTVWQSLLAASRFAVAASLLIVGIGIGSGTSLYLLSDTGHPASVPTTPWDMSAGGDVIATTGATSNAVWQSSEVPETPPTCDLRVGQRLRIESGLVSITHRNGTQLILEGPATYEARSDRGGKLFAGQATVDVPDGSTAFVVATQAGQFHFAGGGYGVAVQPVGAGGGAEIHAFDSGDGTSVTQSRFIGAAKQGHRVEPGQALQVSEVGELVTVRDADPSRFVQRMPPQRWRPYEGDAIHLGNLFDDSKIASLSEAMRTDTFQSAAETIDLGVAAVHDGQLDTDVTLAATGVQFNFSNVGGGGPRVAGLPSNDTYRSNSPVPIRTAGHDLTEDDLLVGKIEDGVGMSTNEALTFDLEEIRKAGHLGERGMRFVSDRAGINDWAPGDIEKRHLASSRFVVLVSNETEVLSGYVDGKPYGMQSRGGVFQFDLSEAQLPRVIRRDSSCVKFDVPIPAGARFLTLATCMHDVEHDDHAVFSGARIELSPPPSAIAQDGINPSAANLIPMATTSVGILSKK